MAAARAHAVPRPRQSQTHPDRRRGAGVAAWLWALLWGLRSPCEKTRGWRTVLVGSLKVMVVTRLTR